jgi:winged helix-turn-helix DNA-binding protein/HNH endonuclease
MIDWWQETDTAILECLRRHGAMSPAPLGRHLGISEGAATAFLAMLVREGSLHSTRRIGKPAARQKPDRTGSPLPAADRTAAGRPPARALRGRWGALEVHHVIKRAQGGSDFDRDRLLALCPPCHAQTDAPYARGRLLITPLGDGRFTADVTRGADKWAIRA